MRLYIKQIILILALCACLALPLLASADVRSSYELAQELLAEGHYVKAAELFESVGGYEDASRLAMYCKAIWCAEIGEYETAIQALTSLGKYKDCELRVTYYSARKQEIAAEHNIAGLTLARDTYAQIPLFLDSRERLTMLEEKIELLATTTANSFMVTISQVSTAHKIIFHIVTSSNVTAVRVLDERRNIIPTKITLSIPNSETTTMWMFELTTEKAFSGNVQAQIEVSDMWLDTDLWQTINIEDILSPNIESVIYRNDTEVTSYRRGFPLNMAAGDDYLPNNMFGITTYRSTAFRQNAAVGTVTNPTSLNLEWTVEAGYAAGSSRNYYGIGWTGQPAIVRWPADIRSSMNVNEENIGQKYLTEVIVAGLDGKIHFLDLLDGGETRDAINFGYPMRATPSIHPLGYPMMTFGQYARKMKSGTSNNIGLYYYSLADQKKLRMIDGLDRKLKRPYSDNASGAFDTSALIDRNTNTLIAIGANGLLYTEKLIMSTQLDNGTGELLFTFEEPTESVTMMSHTKNQKASNVAVESSLAMYGSYAYYADMDGVLRCVDTTTMTTVWAVNTGDAVRAAIALDLEEGEDTNILWLYTANLVNKRSKGDVTIRRFNAMTGEEDWAFAIHCADAKKKDVTFNAVVTPGAMASPVIGQQGLKDLVYFTLSSVSITGTKALSGDGAMAGVIIAFNKATGEVIWHKAMDAYCYSSPVAVYDKAGKGWIIQACSNGTIYLLNGLTGQEINTLQVNGIIEGSPAVYGDMMVIGTTGKDTSYIYGIKIK